MSSTNSSGESSIPASACQRVPAPGSIAVDIEVLFPFAKCGLESITSTAQPELGGPDRSGEPAPGPGDHEVDTVGRRGARARFRDQVGGDNRSPVHLGRRQVRQAGLLLISTMGSSTMGDLHHGPSSPWPPPPAKRRMLQELEYCSINPYPKSVGGHP